MFDKLDFNDLVKILREDLDANIIIEDKGNNKFVLIENDANLSETEFTQINFRFERDVLIIPWFFIKKSGLGIGTRVMEWFVNFCLENSIVAIEIRGVKKDKEGKKKRLDKFDFMIIRQGEYMDYRKLL